ncbi:MAG TPA: hypothetical protein VME19_12700 [Streptosporangiaceae bacterium]|nr:hypothetical protein [Streptosporangiaceae bacterium]
MAAGADLKVVQDMLGRSSIVLTADTYTSVLPEVARKAAEDIATLIIAAGCLVPAPVGLASPSRPTVAEDAGDPTATPTRDGRSAVRGTPARTLTRRG